VINAIVDAADPVTLLQRYQQLASTTQDIVSTDIPRSALDDFVDLAFLVKDAGVRSVVFDDTVIDPAYPDYDRMRAIVDEALGAAPAADPAGTATDDPAGTADDAAADDATPAPGTASPTPPAEGGQTPPATDVADACAFDPVAAAEAQAAGEPPSKSG
jgi:hypothetical protein